MLLTYEKYQALGGELPEQTFDYYEILSESDLNAIGGGILPDNENTIQICMLAMINAYEAADKVSSAGVVSGYSNDGVSVSYKNDTSSLDILETARNRIKSIFASYGISAFLGVRHRE